MIDIMNQLAFGGNAFEKFREASKRHVVELLKK